MTTSKLDLETNIIPCYSTQQLVVVAVLEALLVQPGPESEQCMAWL